MAFILSIYLEEKKMFLFVKYFIRKYIKMLFSGRIEKFEGFVKEAKKILYSFRIS